MTRLNIGCGATPTPGWANFDNSWTIRAARNPALKLLFTATGQMRGKADYLAAIERAGVAWADASRHIPRADASVDVIYTSHMLEHLTRAEVDGFLREALRVLKAGGILRIAVPDIDWHLSEYRVHGDPDRFIAGLCMTSEAPASFRGKLRHLMVGERHHQWMYNGASLSKRLIQAGFAEARVLPPGETGIADPGALDLREREPESVFVEARKRG